MKGLSIPAGIAALGVALAVGFAWEMLGTSGGQSADADGQSRALVATHGLFRGDRLDAERRPLVARPRPTASRQGRLDQPVFGSRYANAFAGIQTATRDETANDDASDTAMAYASPQATASAALTRLTAPPRVAAAPAAPTRSIVPPEKSTRLASLEPPSAASELADVDDHTAIYDISAHTVYLPGGEKLEAHSGLGSHIDDPSSASLRNRGATPPNIYRLAMRERIFHGVRAIRLIPIGDGNMHGRDGMLAHTYMLGPNGQSNGCLVMRNYPAFLSAFLSGKIERLVVVDHLPKSANPRIASLR